MQGNPPPTPLYAAHRFAQRGFPRRLGPSRVAPSTLNEILKQHFNETNIKFKRAGFRKPVHVCDSMDLCACGFETRSFAPQTVSPRRRISSHGITQTCTMVCSIPARFYFYLSIFKTILLLVHSRPEGYGYGVPPGYNLPAQPPEPSASRSEVLPHLD